MEAKDMAGIIGGAPDDIVGHKTLRDGAHIPLRRDEAEAIHAQIEAADADRKARIPDEASALRLMMDAWIRLKDMGWREAIYCPKDGSHFQVIEAGSTGIHDANYEGEWPNGAWWVYDGDMWPSRPMLFRLYPDDQAKEDERKAALQAALSLKEKKNG